MKEYSVEMCYGICVSMECIQANSEQEAVEIARKKFEEDPGAYASIVEVNFDSLNYVGED